MASRQAQKEENAEAAAKVAVDNLVAANKESSKTKHEEEGGENRGYGVLGSILKSVGDRYEQVKDRITPHNYGHKDEPDLYKPAGNKDTVVDKTGEYKDYTAEKGKEAKDTAQQKASQYAGYASEMTGDIKDYSMDMSRETADTAKEEKDAVAARMAELKQTAAAAARRTMDMFISRQGGFDFDQKAREGGDINEAKYGEGEFKAREKMAELKLKEEGVHEEEKQREWAEWETAADRGMAARKNIHGSKRSWKESIKEKLTYPSDVVQEVRASREHGRPKTVEEGQGPKGAASMPSGPAKAYD